MTSIASGRNMTIWAIVVLMLAVACLNGVAAPGDARLGEQAHRAIDQWPAAQQADQGWEWVRILVFLVQIALSEQGFDPGKPDGLMGPNTMTALLAWRGEKGEPLVAGSKPSWDIADIVAQLLHVTLEAMGLSPGPRDEILGRESTAALQRWDDTFTWGAISMDIGAHEVARKTVMEGFGQAPSSDAEEARKDHSPDADVGQDRTAGGNSGEDASHCVQISWGKRSPWYHLDSSRGIRYHVEKLELRITNTCDFKIYVALKHNGLAGISYNEADYSRPPRHCDLLPDDQPYGHGSGLNRIYNSQATAYETVTFVKGSGVGRVNHCAEAYDVDRLDESGWYTPDCASRMPWPRI